MYSQNTLSSSLPEQKSLCGIICQSSVLPLFLQKGFDIIKATVPTAEMRQTRIHSVLLEDDVPQAYGISGSGKLETV